MAVCRPHRPPSRRRAACPHAATVPGALFSGPRWLRRSGNGGVWAPRPTGAVGDAAYGHAARFSCRGKTSPWCPRGGGAKRRRGSEPAVTGGLQSLSLAARASSLYTREPALSGIGAGNVRRAYVQHSGAGGHKGRPYDTLSILCFPQSRADRATAWRTKDRGGHKGRPYDTLSIFSQGRASLNPGRTAPRRGGQRTGAGQGAGAAW